MTLHEWLRTLPADPTDPTSPKLIVGEGALKPAQRQQVVGTEYARRPYAVVQLLQRGGAAVRLHNTRPRLTGGIRVHLHHPHGQLGPPRTGAELAELQALLARAPDHVTEISPGYKLAKPLALGTELDPRPETFDAFDGLTAVTQFTYAIWR